jgi:hypothetical protein
MHTAPEQRFESVHALGRELLPFGSAHAREKWRAYYLDDRLKAPPKASTHAMPLIEAMARGLSPATPSSDPAGFASTALAEPIITPRQVTPLSPSVGAAASASAPTASRVSAVATASESNAKTARATRWPLWGLVLAFALGLSATGWVVSRRPSGVASPKVVLPLSPAPRAAPAAAPIPTAPRAPVPPPIVPTAPRAPAPPPIVPLAPRHAPAAALPPPAPPAHAGTAHRRKERMTVPERAADGVPIMP